MIVISSFFSLLCSFLDFPPSILFDFDFDSSIKHYLYIRAETAPRYRS